MPLGANSTQRFIEGCKPALVERLAMMLGHPLFREVSIAQILQLT